MKFFTILLFSLILLIIGFSDCCDPGLFLWEKRQMDDDQRIYGNPYEGRDRWEDIHYSTTRK